MATRLANNLVRTSSNLDKDARGIGSGYDIFQLVEVLIVSLRLLEHLQTYTKFFFEVLKRFYAPRASL